MKKRRKHCAEKTAKKADRSVVSVDPPRAENELRQCTARTTAVHQHVAQAAQGTALAGIVLKWGFLFSAEIKSNGGTAIFCMENR